MRPPPRLLTLHHRPALARHRHWPGSSHKETLARLPKDPFRHTRQTRRRRRRCGGRRERMLRYLPLLRDQACAFAHSSHPACSRLPWSTVCGAAARSHRWLCPLCRPRYAIAGMASVLPPGRRPAAAQSCDRKHRLTTLAFWAAALPLAIRLPSQPIISTQYCSKERPGSEGPCGPGLNSKLNEGWWVAAIMMVTASVTVTAVTPVADSAFDSD